MRRPGDSEFRTHDRDRGRIVTRSFAATRTHVWMREFDAADCSVRYRRTTMRAAVAACYCARTEPQCVSPHVGALRWVDA